MSCDGRFDFATPQWCPGCGNFSILDSVKDALCNLGLTSLDFIIIAGIGQNSKLGFSVKANLFNGLHGRALPVATGVNLANHTAKLLTVSGDGDNYSEGGNHFIHAARRNLDITVLAGDNRVYGLTKGQASPTSPPQFVTPIHPEGVGGTPINPAFLALASGATFVARAFSGDKAQLTALIEQAIVHRGFALVDILFPCITFNKINTFGWIKDRVKPVGDEHDTTDFDAAVRLASHEQTNIPTGVLYRAVRPTFDERYSMLKAGPLSQRVADLTPERVRPLFEAFK